MLLYDRNDLQKYLNYYRRLTHHKALTGIFNSESLTFLLYDPITDQSTEIPLTFQY